MLIRDGSKSQALDHISKAPGLNPLELGGGGEEENAHLHLTVHRAFLL